MFNNIFSREYLKGFVLFSLQLALALLVSGCMASNVNIRPPITKENKVQTEGIVVARIINASGSFFPINQLTLTPKDVNKSKENLYPRLQALSDFESTSSLFISNVPVGDYSITNARSIFYFGQSSYSVWADGGVELGTFKVQPGKITDLGLFVYYRKVEGDKYTNELIRVPDSNNGALVQQYQSFLQYDQNSVLSWNEDGFNNERTSRYISLVQNPTTFSKYYLSKSGSLWMLGKLGAILEWTKMGEWKQYAIETNSDLLSISQNTAGDVLVGGDTGALFYRSAKGEWTDISLSVGYKIFSVEYNSQDEAIIYATYNGQGIVFKGNPSNKNVQWEFVLYYDSLKGWMNSKGDLIDASEPLIKTAKNIGFKSRVSTFALENFLDKKFIRVSIQSTGAQREYQLFNPIARKLYSISSDLTSIKFEHKLAGEMDLIVKAGVSSFGVKYPMGGVGAGQNDYFIFESNSASWTPISRSIDNCPNMDDNVKECKVDKKMVKRKEYFNFIGSPLLLTPISGVAIVESASPNFGSDAPIYFLKTSDAGKNWKKIDTKLPGNYCRHLVTEVTDRIMLSCSGVSGDFYESLDGGLNWNHVRQQGNF